MRTAANKHRRNHQFEFGDKVLLKLQQYRQHSVAKPLSENLARIFYGPFLITERIGPVAYRLQLPQGSRIHYVFHVSLLRLYVEGADSGALPALPREFLGASSVVHPVEILDHRTDLLDGQ